MWVEDHEKGEFVSLLTATFVRGKDLGTPMGYDILAFKESEAAASFAKTHSAEVVPLEALLKTNTVSEAHR